MMKKRTLFLTLALTMAMSMTALTGCGTKTSATDDAIVEDPCYRRRYYERRGSSCWRR